MRLVFVTQTVDADHPVLAQTVDLVRALAARCDVGRSSCATPCGRHDLPGNVRLRTFGARDPPRARHRASSRAAAASLLAAAHAAGRGARAHGPALRPARGAAGEAASRPAPPLVHALECRAGRSGLRSASWTSSSASAAARSRSRRRSCTRPATRSTSPASRRSEDAPARRPAAACSRLGRTARWKGYDTMLRGLELAIERGLDAQLELRGPQLTEDEEAHRASWRTSSGARRCCATAFGSRLRLRATRSRTGCADRRRAPQRDPAARERDARQGRLRGGCLRRAGAREQRGARRVPRRPSGRASLPAARRGEACGDAARLRCGRTPTARAGCGSGAPPPRRRGALRRIVGGRGHEDRCRPDPRVTSSPWRSSLLSRRCLPVTATFVRRGRTSSSRAPVADVRAARARGHLSCPARHRRAVARSLPRARAAQRRLRRHRPLEPPLAHGVRGVAAVPDSDHPARLLAGGAVRHAGSAAPVSGASRRRCCSSR